MFKASRRLQPPIIRPITHHAAAIPAMLLAEDQVDQELLKQVVASWLENIHDELATFVGTPHQPQE